MEYLSEAKQEAIKRMRTVRLTRELIQRGGDEDSVELMNRAQLEEAWAHIVAEGRDTPPEETDPDINTAIFRALSLDSSQQLERDPLAFEQRKHEEERQEWSGQRKGRKESFN